MTINRWGAPAPSGPPMAVEEPTRVHDPAAPVYLVQAQPKTTAVTLREQMQARADELTTQIAGMAALQLELDLLHRMLEVK